MPETTRELTWMAEAAITASLNRTYTQLPAKSWERPLAVAIEGAVRSKQR